MDEAFSERKWLGGEAFKSSKLRRAAEKVLAACGVDVNTRMFDPRTDGLGGCKVMICVAPEADMRTEMPMCLRTYITHGFNLPDCTIIDAICATFAVPGLFKPLEIYEPGGLKSKYVGLGSFNPTPRLLDEAADIFQDKYVACVISLGAEQDNLFEAECGRTARDMIVRFTNWPGVYFRLHVSQGMESIATTDWNKRLDGLKSARAYLKLPDNSSKIAAAADALANRSSTISTTYLRGVIPLGISNSNRIMKGCPLPSTLFVGRDKQLNDIERCLASDMEGRRVCVLHGAGGVGKTQLALKYVELHKNQYSYIYYVDCTSRHTLEAELKSIATVNKVGNLPDDALTWLARLNERWLLIYNNANDAALNLRGYFPACSRGNIIITTRNYGMTALAHDTDAAHHIVNMTENEAHKLLARASGLSTNHASTKLIQAIGCFPLAIVQAGAYIRVHKCEPEEYLSMYEASQGQILEECANEVQWLDNHEPNMYATWRLSYQKLDPVSRQLFDIVAFMHHDGITEDIFSFAVLGLKGNQTSQPPVDGQAKAMERIAELLSNFTGPADGVWDRAAFVRATFNLTSYSLLTFDSTNTSYSMHPLVQQWTRIMVNDPEMTCSCTTFLLALSVSSGDKTEDYVYRRTLLSHVDALPDDERLRLGGVAWRFQTVYAEAGRIKDAEKIAKSMYETSMKLFGRENHYSLISMARLAYTYTQQDRLMEAQSIQQEIVESAKRLWGSEHPYTLKSIARLAQTYSSQGRWTDAEVLQKEVLEVAKRVWGLEDTNTLEIMGGLAQTYFGQCRWVDAEKLQREALEAGKRQWGDDHPNTLLNGIQLARIYSKQQRWNEAEPLQRSAVEIGKHAWGSDHPNTIAAEAYLGETYLGQGRYPEAQVLLQKVVEVAERVRGSEAVGRLVAMIDLVEAYLRQGKLAAAEALQQELEDRKQAWGGDHSDALIVKSNLGAAYAKHERLAEAEALQREVLEGARRIWGNRHAGTLAAMSYLSQIYVKQERWAEAELLQREAIETRREVWGEHDPRALTTLVESAETYLKMGRIVEAEARLQEVLATGKQSWGNDYQGLVAIANLAQIYLKREKWAEGGDLQQQVVECGKQVWGDSHSNTLLAMAQLAYTYSKQGRLMEAEELQREVFERGRVTWGVEHADTLLAMSNLADTYSRQKQWAKEEPLRRELVEVMIGTWGGEHPNTLIAMANLAVAYVREDQLAEAEALQRDVFENRKKIWGNEHPSTLIAMAHLAQTYSGQSRSVEAEVLQREVLASGMRVWGKENPNTLSAMDHLATTLSKKGEWLAAEALRRDALKIGEQTWGSEHSDLLVVKSGLATTLGGLGRWEEAKDLQQDVLERRRRASGHGDPHTLLAMHDLAITLYHLDQFQEAESLMSDAVNGRRVILGDSNPGTIESIEKLQYIQQKLTGKRAYKNVGRKLFLLSVLVLVVAWFFCSFLFDRALY
ncbi:kinesin light chain [Ceratobasidium sp. AG-Ba]|nr:kinesin light chain [Ceratobasidium sp. AG-Ba]